MKYEGEYYERRLEARRPPDGEWKPQCTPGPCPNHNDDQLLHDWCTAYPQFEWRIAPMTSKNLPTEYLEDAIAIADIECQERTVARATAELAEIRRIHDAQAARIAELEAKYEGPKDHVATELVNRMLAEHPQLKARIAELEKAVEEEFNRANANEELGRTIAAERDARATRIAELEAKLAERNLDVHVLHPVRRY